MGNKIIVFLFFFFVLVVNAAKLHSTSEITTNNLRDVSFRMLPQVDMLGSCKANPSYIRAGTCMCYLVFTKKVNVKRVKMIVNGCKATGLSKAIRTRASSCKPFLNKKGKVKKAQLSKVLNNIIKKCFRGNPPIELL